MENESLRQLCEQAGKEQDPNRLMEIVQEIIKALDAGRAPKRADEATDMRGLA
jgi:hypothetical protein